MIEILTLLVVFVLLVLGIVWGHFIYVNRASTTSRDVEQLRENTNVALYHEHKAEIEKDYKEGTIDEENYQYLLAELDKGLLQDVEQNKTVELTEERPLSIVWPVAITLFVLVFSIGYYSKHGAMEQISKEAPTAADNQQMQVYEQKEAILKEIESNPNDGDLWYSLGQSYVALGQFDEALAAYDKVISIEGEKAELYGAQAQALYYQSEQQITPQVKAKIDQALAIDPVDPATNILMGMHNFMGENYPEAIKYWQKVIDADRESVNSQALQEAVQEAKNRLAAANGQPAVAGASLAVNVSLSDEILEKLSQGEDKTVFIYALPAQGPRMPLAAVKLMASDLPTQIILDDTQAMTPQTKLSDANVVHIYAVVSQSGGAGIQPGDFKAEATHINVATTKELELVINTVVPERE